MDHFVQFHVIHFQILKESVVYNQYHHESIYLINNFTKQRLMTQNIMINNLQYLFLSSFVQLATVYFYSSVVSFVDHFHYHLKFA